MSRLERSAVGVAGLASWVAGTVATFIGGNGSGAVALIAVGAAASILAIIGHWPSRIVVSGNELAWEEFAESVEQQIEAAEDAGDDTAVKELEDLRRRLAEAQRTGFLPMHPAAEYDQFVYAALRRILPGLNITASLGRARDQADFVLPFGVGNLLVETKYKSDPRRPFAGSTLAALFPRMGDSDRLLVVTNATNIDDGRKMVNEALGHRGRVVTWLGPKDDATLQRALDELMDLRLK